MNLTPMRAGVFAALGVLAFFVLVINSEPHGWQAWYGLWRSGQTTRATVMQLHPEDHHGCSFRYTVDSKEYEAMDDGCNARVGEVVSITYSPTNPTFATLRSPKQEFLFLLLAPLLVSALAGLASAWRVTARSSAKP